MKKLLLLLLILPPILTAQEQRNPMMEYLTGTWCSWCPCGDIIVQQILSDMPNAIFLAYHSGGPSGQTDPWQEFPGNNIKYLLNYLMLPSGVIDRTGPPLPREAWADTMNSRNYVPATVNITTTGSFNSITRVIDLNIHAKALQNLSGSYKMNLVILEDSLVYAQTGNSSCPGDPEYVHFNVVRAMINGAEGEELNGINPWNTGETITKNVSYLVPSEFIVENCKLVVFVYKEDTPLYEAEIQQAVKLSMTSLPEPYVEIISPNGGESWEVGSNQNITWESSGVSFLKIEYTTNNGIDWMQIANSIPSANGNYEWTVTNTASSDCKIRINDTANPNVYDESDSAFTIFNSRFLFTPETTFLQDTLGSEIIFNVPIVNISSYPLTSYVTREINDLPPGWQSALCFGSLCFSTNVDSIATTPDFNIPPINPGDTLQFSLHVFPQINTGSAHIRLRAGDYYNPADTAYVDLYTEAELPKKINLIIPNGGESWLVGSVYNIIWTSTAVSDVKIEYSTNSGVSWNTIINSTPSSGSYAWTVPNTSSNNCRIKISDISDPLIFGESTNDFAILQPLIIVNSPNGGEGWQIGSAQNITWTSSNVSKVKIEYSTNNGSSWIIIVDSTLSNGTYEWTVPSTPSTNCKVKISDITNATIFDLSDGTFSIFQFEFYAHIEADSIWLDTDFNGSELGLVDGSGSYINQGTIINYEWYVNNEYITNNTNPEIELITGTNIVKLIVYSDLGFTASDSTYISVYASSLSTGGAILSGISQFGNSYYVTSMNNGVYRIDSTGNILQSYITGGSIQSSLCISNQTNLMYVGSSDTRLYCFDNALNSLWDRGLGGVVNSAVSVNFNGEIVYVGANDNNTNLGLLKSLLATNGNPRWTFQADGTILSSPVVIEIVDSNNVVSRTIIYFGTSKGTMYAIEDLGAAYNLFWTETTYPDSAFVSSPAISEDGMLYIGSKNGYLYRFNWDGSYQNSWRKYTGGPIISSPIIDENNIVYIASGSGYIYGFNKYFTSNSDPVKSFYQNLGINGTAGIGPDGTLLVGCNNGKFLALDKNLPGLDMPIKWYFQVSGSLLAPTLVTDNGIVFIGSTNGDIFIMRDPNIGEKQLSLSNYEWPTFKGDNQRSKVVRIIDDPTFIEDDEKNATNYILYQNYPNPFNPSTKIKYSVPQSSQVIIKFFDVLGNELETLVNKEKPAGIYELNWIAEDLPSGIYFYRIQAGSFIDTKKMILLK